jgi:tetratricopeptide (TPR) repeat protein
VQAEEALERAHSLNPEETGALLVLGEVSLMRGNFAKAEERFKAVCQTNAKAFAAFFLRGYLSWRRGEFDRAKTFLQTARTALGNDWKPAGASAEGDVQAKHHVDSTPLAPFWNTWNGQPEPDAAFAQLAGYLEQFSHRRQSTGNN